MTSQRLQLQPDMNIKPTGVEFFLFLAKHGALQKFRQRREQGARIGPISQDLKEDPYGVVSAAFFWTGNVNPLYWIRIEDRWRAHIKSYLMFRHEQPANISAA